MAILSGSGSGPAGEVITPSYDFPDLVRIFPAGGNTATGIPTNTSYVYEVTPVVDPARYPGNNLIIPDVARMRTAGSDQLAPYTNVNDYTTGMGQLRKVTPDTGSGTDTYGPQIPWVLTYEPGYGPDDLAEQPTRKIRLRLDPRPNGSVTADLDSLTIYEDSVNRYLPGRVVSY
jgi:hypothetical protein